MFWRPKEEPPPRDWRLLSTIGLWMLVTLLFVLSIPIAAILHTALISVAVLIAAVLATAFIWAFGGRSWQDEKRERLGREAAERENEQLRAAVADLESQVEALETMRRYERRAGIFNDAPIDETPINENPFSQDETIGQAAGVVISQSVTKIRSRFKRDGQRIAS